MLAYRAALPVLAVVAACGVAQAKKRDPRERINHSVDDICKAAKASKPQKVQAHAAVADLITVSEETFGTVPGTLPELDDLLRIFVAPKLDVPALETIRKRRDERHGRVSEALVRSFVQMHGIFSRPQREQLAAWAQKKVQGKRLKAFQKVVVTGLVNVAVELVLDQIGATDPERVVARQSRDSLTNAVLAARGDAESAAATLSAIFVPDELDRGALESFRVDREQRVRDLTLALQQAMIDLHAGLTPEHRLKLAAIARDRVTHRSSAPVNDSDGDSEGFQ